jgi:two-component system response regulator DegU
MNRHRSIKVLVADPNEHIRNSLAKFLGRSGQLEIVGTASNSQEIVELCDQIRPDIVLLDLPMLAADGITVTHAIRQNHPDIEVIALTDEQAELEQALDDGASESLVKSASAYTILDTIKRFIPQKAG